MSKDHSNLGEKFALIREKDVKIPLNAALACAHFRLFKTQPMDQIECIKNALKFDQITIVGLLPLEVHGGSSRQFIQIRQLRLQYLKAFGWPGTKGAAFLPHHYGVFAQTRGQVCSD